MQLQGLNHFQFLYFRLLLLVLEQIPTRMFKICTTQHHHKFSSRRWSERRGFERNQRNQCRQSDCNLRERPKEFQIKHKESVKRTETERLHQRGRVEAVFSKFNEKRIGLFEYRGSSL